MLLNPAQRQAIEYLAGPLFVLAGAGSGKTRVITLKIAHLIEQQIFKARHIAAITFTNKAAREMQDRVQQHLPASQIKGLTISTFHALGLQILRAEAKMIDFKERFSILDSQDSTHLIAEIAGLHENEETDNQNIDLLKTQISLWKNGFILPEAALSQASNVFEQQAAKIYGRYQEILKSYQAVDFDDLIVYPVLLFKNHPEVLARWQQKIRYLLVDEYQDTNACQFQLIQLLVGESGQLTVVGDDDQAIYAWRGADIQNIHLLSHTFSQLKVIKLEQNYRSTLRILRAANHLIQNNKKLYEKNLWSEHGLGNKIDVMECDDEAHEAESVIMRLLAHKLEHQTLYHDYAILYRSNHQARIFEQQLREQHIPYQISGSTSFFERTEIKDMMAYLRLVANQDDDPAFIRAMTTPKRGFGLTSLEVLGKYAAERQISLFTAAYETGLYYRMCEAGQSKRQYEILIEFCDFINQLEAHVKSETVAALLDRLLQAIDYETYLLETENPKAAQKRWGNVLDFFAWLSKNAEENERNLFDIVQMISLMNILDNKEADQQNDEVRLMTLHAAKGLEFPHVFLIGVEEELLPHRESLDETHIAEERRLMYVGITRAQKTLCLTYCHQRRRGREHMMIEPSRFLAELIQEDLNYSSKRQRQEKVSPQEWQARLMQMASFLKKDRNA